MLCACLSPIIVNEIHTDTCDVFAELRWIKLDATFPHEALFFFLIKKRAAVERDEQNAWQVAANQQSCH